MKSINELSPFIRTWKLKGDEIIGQQETPHHRHFLFISCNAPQLFTMINTNYIVKVSILFCLGTLFSHKDFAQSALQKTKANAKDWIALDPKMDTIAGISLYKAYELLKGKTSTTVIVAVIDNGVDIEHEDLKKAIWTNKKEIPGNGMDDDHNGYVDDVHGWNFRGARDGSIIDNEQAGATQIYSAWKSKYEHADTNVLKPDEKKEWTIYKRARDEYHDKINSSKDSIELTYSYNPGYHSYQLIANDADKAILGYLDGFL